nr:DUF5667 domain-containing protein [Planosporangium flavigriseum]
MNLFFFRRQRAERFAQLLDNAYGGARHPDACFTADQELNDLMGVGDRLRRIDVDAQADPEFRTDLRAMLMATIERDGIGASAVEPDATRQFARRPAATASMLAWLPLRSRRARGAVVVGLAVSALALASMSALSGDAKPGDALYGVKRSGEQAQVALSSSQLSRGQLYLDFARTRLNEAAAGRGDVVAILADMDGETRQGVRLITATAVERRDPASLDPIDVFAAGQRHTIAGMLATLTGTPRTRTVASLQLLDQITQRVATLRTSLNCGDLSGSPVDELGPVPGGCAIQNPSASGVYGAPTGSSPARNDATQAPASGLGVTTSGTTPRGITVTRPAAQTPATSAPQPSQPADDGLLDRIARMLGVG